VTSGNKPKINLSRKLGLEGVDDLDATISSPITVISAGAPGNLTLQAGRSILLNAGITTAGGTNTSVVFTRWCVMR